MEVYDHTGLLMHATCILLWSVDRLECMKKFLYQPGFEAFSLAVLGGALDGVQMSTALGTARKIRDAETFIVWLGILGQNAKDKHTWN